jgi:hypothetical protein
MNLADAGGSSVSLAELSWPWTDKKSAAIGE